MPLPARRRRKKGPDEAERATSFTAEVMAPTRMKLRRRRDAAAAASPAGGAAPEADRSRESRRSSSRRRSAAAKAPPAVMAAAASPPPSTSSGAARPAVAAEASPDSKCPICLDRFNNLAYLDHCLHRFCFPCIQEWSHNKAECPLCKQPFASILHSVRAEDDFKEYTLQPPPPRAATQLTASTFVTTVAAMTADGEQHHVRLMVRRHLVASDGGGVRRRRRRRERAAPERVGEWEFIMQSPSLPVSPYRLDVSELIMDDMRVEEGAEEMMRRDEERRQEPAAAPAPPPGGDGRASRRLLCRLAVRRRLQREGGAVQMRDREVAAFRKALYRSGIRVRGVSGNPGRPRSVTAEAFRRGGGQLARLSAWLRRELAVLLGPDAALSDAAQRAVTGRLLRSGLEDGAALEDELRPFLSGRTEHFVHELLSFARSPLSMESYDQLAVYEPPAAAAELESLSSPSDGSSVIAISEGEDGGGAEAAGRHDDGVQTGSSLSLSGWDDETPGPSYTSAEPPLATPPQPEEAEPRGEEEECLIVGYKKPIAERTPELVQLSSDSEEDEGEKKKKKEEQEVEVGSTAVDKTPPPPAPCLPIIPPSTSGAFRAEQQKEAESRRRSGSWSDSSGRSRKSVCSLSPAPPQRRRRDRKQHGERRRKRKQQQQQRDWSREPHGKSGTFCNPNRSIFPPMMTRCSPPPPFDSSADSASPPSPTDSGWALRLSQVSPLTSSASSSPSRSFSPLCSSPGTPPSPPRSPKRPHHAEKPGGKRKYKSRHLNSSRDSSRRPSRGLRRDRERRRRLRSEAEGRDSSTKTGSRRSRDDRSPSVEIIYEGTIDSAAAQPSAHKRRRRRLRRAQVTSSPVIITLDSDGSHDDQKKTASGSSSPLSSQQTIDFSDLPLAACAGGGGATEVGELPADILDRGSDGSEPEAAAQNQNVRPAGRSGRADDPSDRYLLEAILDDLNRIAAPPRDGAAGFLSERRERTPQERTGPTSPAGRQQNPDPDPDPVPLERMEGWEVPPLLRRAGPVGSHHRNTPPPLKHKDAGSPAPSVGPHRTSDPTGSASPGPASAIQNQPRSASPRLPARPGSDRLPSLRFGSFLSMESFRSSDSLDLPLTPATSKHSPGRTPAQHRNPASPTRRIGAGGLGPPGWDWFSALNCHGAAAAFGSGSTSNHTALAPPPPLCFIQSERSSQSESRSEPIRLPESNPASQNRTSPGSLGQNQQQLTGQLGPHGPAHRLHDPAHNRHGPAHNRHDPAHQLHPDSTHHLHVDSAHRLHLDSAHRLHLDSAHQLHLDSAHLSHDPIRLSDSPPNFSFDSAHRQSSRLSGSAHLLFDSAHRQSSSRFSNSPSPQL